MGIRATVTLVLLGLVAAASAPQGSSPREALALGRTHDEALYASFHNSYKFPATGVIDSAEIITEFRRAVMIVHARALQGDYSLGDADVVKAMAPYSGLVTCIVQVRLHPLNVFAREPAYDLYLSTGPRSPPIGSRAIKREPVYPPGAEPGSSMVAVRLEASFPRAEIERAEAPRLIVTDEKAEILWQARLDLSRYR
jgi:hypothetical protein